MRTLASLLRGCAALILLLLISCNGRELRAEASPSAASDPVVGDAGQVAAGQEPSDPEPGDPEPGDPEPGDPEPSDPEPSDTEASDTEPLAVRDESPAIDDDAWLISTRHLGCSSWTSEDGFDLNVSRYSAAGEWIDADLNELWGGDRRLTVVYVHGNRVDYGEAIRRAWRAFGVLQADPSAPPMRLIIWSWPSDQIHGQIRDVRSKGCRTNTEGHYLGWFLSKLDAKTPVSLIGYSFGARVVTGALHVLGGGSLAGQSPPPAPEGVDRSPMQVVLLAAALNNYWLSSGGFHDRFWSCADRVLVLYNSCDPALKRYHVIERHGHPAAVGYTGARGLDDDHAARTEQRDVCCSVGRTHREDVFFSSAEVVQGIQQHLLFQAPQD